MSEGNEAESLCKEALAYEEAIREQERANEVQVLATKAVLAAHKELAALVGVPDLHWVHDHRDVQWVLLRDGGSARHRLVHGAEDRHTPAFTRFRGSWSRRDLGGGRVLLWAAGQPAYILLKSAEIEEKVEERTGAEALAVWLEATSRIFGRNYAELGYSEREELMGEIDEATLEVGAFAGLPQLRQLSDWQEDYWRTAEEPVTRWSPSAIVGGRKVLCRTIVARGMTFYPLTEDVVLISNNPQHAALLATERRLETLR